MDSVRPEPPNAENYPNRIQPQESAWELFNEFCKLKKIRRENIVSVHHTKDFESKTSILLVYEGKN